MSASTIITLGYGSFGAPRFIISLGYGFLTAPSTATAVPGGGGDKERRDFMNEMAARFLLLDE